MKLGVKFPEKWIEKSKNEQIPLSDLLYGYVLEDIMKRIIRSEFHEYLWLTNEKIFGIEAYRKKHKERFDFIYVETGKKSFQLEPLPGQSFSIPLMKKFANQIFAVKENSKVEWEYQINEKENGILILAVGTYLDMRIPINIGIYVIQVGGTRPKKRMFTSLFDDKKTYEFLLYSKENVLSEAIFEIMRKLELISNMEAYDTVNEIIKNQSISGRHIIEDLKSMGEKEPKVIALKRLEQVASYKNYGYMKKRWQQYSKRYKINADEWEVVMDRILTFLNPLWKAVCEDDIFFDDWMPELGRFLG